MRPTFWDWYLNQGRDPGALYPREPAGGFADPHECDPHVALARSESREGPGLRCGTCGKRAEGNYSDDAGPVCDACIGRK